MHRFSPLRRYRDSGEDLYRRRKMGVFWDNKLGDISSEESDLLMTAKTHAEYQETREEIKRRREMNKGESMLKAMQESTYKPNFSPKGYGQTLIPSVLEEKTIYVEDMEEDKDLLNALNTNQEDLKKEIKEQNRPIQNTQWIEQPTPETLLFNFEREINPTKRIKIGEEIIRRMTK